jgi:hypothetical protein
MMNIQSGSFRLNTKSADWSLDQGEGDRLLRREIKFPKLFKSPPTVIVNLSGFDIENKHNARLTIHTEDITDEDFVLCVFTWGKSLVYGVNGTWYAYGE